MKEIKILSSCMIGTGEWMLVGGELKDSGTDGTRETDWRN